MNLTQPVQLRAALGGGSLLLSESFSRYFLERFLGLFFIHAMLASGFNEPLELLVRLLFWCFFLRHMTSSDGPRRASRPT